MAGDYIGYIRSMVGTAKVIMVVSGAIVLDENNRILLQRRSDNGFWGFPGGYMEIGETVEDTARREVYEETGLLLGELQFFGIYSGPDYEVTYSNGDQTALVQVMYLCSDYSGDIQDSPESLETRFFDRDEIPDPILPTHRAIVEKLLATGL